MLVGHHVVLVLRIDGLVLGLDEDLVAREPVAAEVLEEVGVAGAVEVDVRVRGVLVLRRRGGQREPEGGGKGAEGVEGKLYHFGGRRAGLRYVSLFEGRLRCYGMLWVGASWMWQWVG